MEFGKLPPSAIEQVDFSLPSDGAFTKAVLNGPKSHRAAFYVGCAKWGRKEWKGLIYPPKTKEADFLAAYVRQFNSIELNAIFYQQPRAEQMQKWKTIADVYAPGEFLFCPKISRTISHIHRLKNAEKLTDDYLSAIVELKPYLGPCFLQLNDQFGPSQYPVLESYLKKLPEDFSVFVEVRHPQWFQDRESRYQLFQLLKDTKKGAVITDASGRRDCLHMELPIPEAFIRFVGNGGNLLKSDQQRIDEWTLRIKQWLENGLEKVYFFLHQHDEKDTPVIADYTIRRFNETLHSQLPRIRFIQGQQLSF